MVGPSIFMISTCMAVYIRSVDKCFFFFKVTECLIFFLLLEI